MDRKLFKETLLGGVLNNPVFVLVLGMCPTISKSVNLVDAFSLGLMTAFVLICSNVLISLLRKRIPDQVRLPAYIIIIATFTTLVKQFIKSFIPDLDESIGGFIDLIVVNCVILGRAEAFASKNKVGYAALDGVSMGLGFTVAISLLGAIRQALTLAGLNVFAQTAGGFITLGLLMALFNFLLGIYKKVQRRRTQILLKEME